MLLLILIGAEMAFFAFGALWMIAVAGLAAVRQVRACARLRRLAL